MRRIAVAGLIAALALTGCSSSTDPTPAEPSGSAAQAETDRSYDVSGVKKVDEIANLLPENIKSKGTLVVGAAIDYAPAEFRAAFADALKQEGPCWIDCRIGKDEKVLPMIPGGGDINDIIME